MKRLFRLVALPLFGAAVYFAWRNRASFPRPLNDGLPLADRLPLHRRKGRGSARKREPWREHRDGFLNSKETPASGIARRQHEDPMLRSEQTIWDEAHVAHRQPGQVDAHPDAGELTAEA